MARNDWKWHFPPCLPVLPPVFQLLHISSSVIPFLLVYSCFCPFHPLSPRFFLFLFFPVSSSFFQFLLVSAPFLLFLSVSFRFILFLLFLPVFLVSSNLLKSFLCLPGSSCFFPFLSVSSFFPLFLSVSSRLFLFLPTSSNFSSFYLVYFSFSLFFTILKDLVYSRS